MVRKPAGERAGMRTALILTGVSRREEVAASRWQPTGVVEGYSELVEIIRADNARR